MNTDLEDELNDINTCLQSISELLIPETDMHVIDRDKFSILLNYLLRRQSHALTQVQSIKG